MTGHHRHPNDKRRESLTQMVLSSSQTGQLPELGGQDNLNTNIFKNDLEKTHTGSLMDKTYMVSIILAPKNVCVKEAIIQLHK